MDQQSDEFRIKIGSLEKQMTALRKESRGPDDVRKAIKREVRNEFASKVKSFKDETFSELEHMELQN